MKHLTEEQLIEHYYQHGAAANDHLLECSNCRTEYRRLSEWLNELRQVTVPEPDSEFYQRLWSGIQSRLHQAVPGHASRPRRRWRLSIAAAGAAAMLAVVFYQHSEHAAAKARQAGGDRVLRFVLSDHLKRSHLLLKELERMSPEKAGVEDERNRARDLLEENRLLREAALQRGEENRAAVLDDLGRTLLTVANGPSRLPASDLTALQQRLQKSELSRKVTVTRSQLESSEEDNGSSRMKKTNIGLRRPL